MTEQLTQNIIIQAPEQITQDTALNWLKTRLTQEGAQITIPARLLEAIRATEEGQEYLAQLEIKAKTDELIIISYKKEKLHELQQQTENMLKEADQDYTGRMTLRNQFRMIQAKLDLGDRPQVCVEVPDSDAATRVAKSWYAWPERNRNVKCRIAGNVVCFVLGPKRAEPITMKEIG